MPSWQGLLQQFAHQPDDDARGAWLNAERDRMAGAISGHLGGRNVVLYGSAFLQKAAPNNTVAITGEDLNGLMTVIYGMDWSKGLTLILHTPGGDPTAAQTIVEYLRSKFPSLEAIVPAFAMSAGTMISLAADKIYMGRPSQLGPIDPQFTMNGRPVSARGVVEQFKRAESETLADPRAAHVWAPITQSLGPALLQDAQNALDYSEDIVADWLARYMFSGEADPVAKGRQVAHHFNDASTHKSHGRRIDHAEAAAQGLNIALLEDDQDLQEAVLSLYHLMTITFEHSPTTKMIAGSNGQVWMKNLPVAGP